MAIDTALRNRLLGSIEAGRLAFVCGAGLSIPAPSQLPSAGDLCQACFDKYAAIQKLDEAARRNLERFVRHFYPNDMSIFLDGLVPWHSLNGPPNAGHIAIWDLLVCRAAVAAVSSNFDDMIERHGAGYKFDFRSSLTGEEAVRANQTHSPLLKFHGCMRRPQSTVWLPEQLTDDGDIKQHNLSCRNWMRLNLTNTDLVFIGFWSDWTYFNEIVDAALNSTDPGYVVVVDKGDLSWLSEKAPNLADIARKRPDRFYHFAGSSDDFLTELRQRFSSVWISRLLNLAKTHFEALKGPQSVEYSDAGVSVDDLYLLRQDAEGVSRTSAATTKSPPDTLREVGLCHLILRHAGATSCGSHYILQGQSIRIVNANGKTCSETRADMAEPPSLLGASTVICTNAASFELPEKITQDSNRGSIVRAGTEGLWLRITDATEQLGL